MAKKAINRSDVLAQFDLAELESLIGAKRELAAMEVRRAKLAKELGDLDARIARLGTGTAKRRGRPPGRPKKAAAKQVGRLQAKKGVKKLARGSVKLPDMAVQILAESGEPMRVKELAQKLLEAGYPTRSADFSRVVRILVYKEPRIVKVERGLFTVDGASAPKRKPGRPPKKAAASPKKKTAKKKAKRGPGRPRKKAAAKKK